MSASAPVRSPETTSSPPRRRGPGLLLVTGLGLLLVLLAAAAHVTQGTSAIGLAEVLSYVLGSADPETGRVLAGSRLPRLLAGATVGLALGVAGAALQSIARNPLASPDTLAVNAGAHLAVVASAAVGLSLPTLPAGGMAFVGGLLAAGVVLVVSGGSSTTRLILAGSAGAMALNSVTMLLMLLYQQETIGLFAWGNGSLTAADLVGVRQLAPVVLVTVVVLVVMARRLDILGMGEDTAALLGIRVLRVRVSVVVLAVLLSAAAVTLAGPIGFVGLCAPVIVRLLAPLVPGILSHRALLPLSGMAGVLIVLLADVLLRGALGPEAGVYVPTGVVTTVLGAVVLVLLARTMRDSGPTRQPPSGRPARLRGTGAFVVVLGAAATALVGALVAGILSGDTMVLLGDVANWWTGRTSPGLTFVLDQRLPRVIAAALAGAALAVSGSSVQAVCRNPLAEPGLLGITAGAGLAAVSLLTFVPTAGVWAMTGAAGGGAALAFALVYGLARRGGLNSDRLVLIGVGVSAGVTALITLVIVANDPWNTAKALTWLSGSTYGRTMEQVVPVAVALVLLTPLIFAGRRHLDLLALDDDTPRVLGLRLERTRLLHLGAAAALTATAVSAMGVVVFVGLVAPHVARGLVGGRHVRVIPAAALLGALMVSVADTLGRTVIAPAQVPAGLVTALIGAPYFVWLLWRSRPVG